MMAAQFDGFPSLAKSTAIPNIYFATLLPEIEKPSELLAFLWVQQEAQSQTGKVRFTTAEDLWATAAVRQSFERLAGGREGLDEGLAACVARGALLSLLVSSAERGREQGVPGQHARVTPSRRSGKSRRSDAASGLSCHRAYCQCSSEHLLAVRRAHRDNHPDCRSAPRGRRRALSSIRHRIGIPRGGRAECTQLEIHRAHARTMGTGGSCRWSESGRFSRGT